MLSSRLDQGQRSCRVSGQSHDWVGAKPSRFLGLVLKPSVEPTTLDSEARGYSGL